MFGIDLPELIVIIAVAIIVIGPKDLPHALYSAGKIFRKFKAFTSDVQGSLHNIINEVELDEIAREANKPGGENLQFEIEKQIQEENKRKGITD